VHRELSPKRHVIHHALEQFTRQLMIINAIGIDNIILILFFCESVRETGSIFSPTQNKGDEVRVPRRMQR
jgi:hypothetical protein